MDAGHIIFLGFVVFVSVSCFHASYVVLYLLNEYTLAFMSCGISYKYFFACNFVQKLYY